ncbi:hypothetical protein VMCG_03247 [Cytospora schulzeri]|uniref:Uncharacterized protein n=1 Tax=Cytospora schulzeri TaxID=448051 RepID=A0A423WXZ3_9PEZI|nr:hypothetical protein VMCG_03247 [Valsa malicola]
MTLTHFLFLLLLGTNVLSMVSLPSSASDIASPSDSVDVVEDPLPGNTHMNAIAPLDDNVHYDEDAIPDIWIEERSFPPSNSFPELIRWAIVCNYSEPLIPPMIFRSTLAWCREGLVMDDNHAVPNTDNTTNADNTTKSWPEETLAEVQGIKLGYDPTDPTWQNPIYMLTSCTLYPAMDAQGLILAMAKMMDWCGCENLLNTESQSYYGGMAVYDPVTNVRVWACRTTIGPVPAKENLTVSMSNPKYYFIDLTANNRARAATHGTRSFNDFVRAAQHWAKRAVERLQDRNDTDFARVFNIIFKTPINNGTTLPKSRRWQMRYRVQSDHEWRPTINHVVSVLSDFANNWTQTTNRQRSNVRFFSDDRQRFRRAPNGMYYDLVNHVYYPDSENWEDLDMGQAVGSSGIPGSVAELPHINPQIRQMTLQENPDRYVIDISANAWRSFTDWDQWLGRQGDFANVDLERLIETSMTRLVLHEILHAPPYLLDDALRDEDPSAATSGWGWTMKCKKGAAHRNAESLALLGLWAVLADTLPPGAAGGGFSLDRSWDRIPGSREDVGDDFEEEELDADQRPPWTQRWTLELPYPPPLNVNQAVAGVIVAYRDITGSRP